jgi:hypothetical protein
MEGLISLLRIQSRDKFLEFLDYLYNYQLLNYKSGGGGNDA